MKTKKNSPKAIQRRRETREREAEARRLLARQEALRQEEERLRRLAAREQELQAQPTVQPRPRPPLAAHPEPLRLEPRHRPRRPALAMALPSC